MDAVAMADKAGPIVLFGRQKGALADKLLEDA
jgi:hypothetical protein